MQPQLLPVALAKVDQLVERLRFNQTHGQTPQQLLLQPRLMTAGLTQAHLHLTTHLFKD
jgi:hypothetical protein